MRGQFLQWDTDRQPGVIAVMLADVLEVFNLFSPSFRPILILFDVDLGRQVIRGFAS